jgi:peptidoglycan/LPS O-acetylase OafA/YrhL
MQYNSVDKEITNYLKGFAILTVYLNHVMGSYISGAFVGYANGFISLFFILSGYGIFISLSQRSELDKDRFHLNFFKKRFVRIYPIFWVWCLLNGFSNGVLGFFGLDFINPKSPWFVPAIIQCYLLSPILYRVFKDMRVKKSMTILIILFILVNVLLFALAGAPHKAIGYRGLFFNNIFLFCLGFMLAKIKIPKELPSYVVYICVFLFLFFIHETTPQGFISFPFKGKIFFIIFPFIVFIFCFSIFSKRIYLPLKNAIQTIGNYTYSIYLFAGVGPFILFKIGVLKKMDPSFTGILVLILLSPVFIWLYSTLEIILNEFIFKTKDLKIVFKNIKQLVYSFNPLIQNAKPESAPS